MRFTAFCDQHLLATGAKPDVAIAAKHAIAANPNASVLMFSDATGRFIDLDLSGSDAEVIARLEPVEIVRAEEHAPKVGRPKLGVVAKEITLLPRHWDWLAKQPGGASSTLRKLVENARKANESQDVVRQAQTAANSFMSAMLGDQPDYEEASRALFAGNASTFKTLTAQWPTDLRNYLARIAAPAFSKAKDE